jgi:ADP-ribosylglycohydrolase
LWPQQIPDRKWLLNTFVEIEGYPRGQFTDDTQLSVATVQSLVKCGALSLPHVARSIARLLTRA